MSRLVFEKVQAAGFQSTRVESLAITSNGQKMFLGTSDGFIQLYDCNPGSKRNHFS